MIAVKLTYQDKTLTGIESKGHSGSAPAGRDIICAAVSAIMQAMILGLENIAQVHGLNVEADERVPIIRAAWPSSEQERVSLLTKTAAASLKQIARENPKYVKIITEEN